MVTRRRPLQLRPFNCLTLFIIAVVFPLGIVACGSDSGSAPVTSSSSGTSSSGYLFVANGNGPDVLTFKAKANGDVAPSAILKSADFSDPEGVAIVYGDILVGDEGTEAAYEFPFAVSGARNILPTSTNPGQKSGAIALDTAGNYYLVNEGVNENGGGQVAEFNSSMVAQCVINYPEFVNPEGIAVDPNTGNIWVSDVGYPPAAPEIYEFPTSSGCPSTPTTTLGGASTKLQYPYAIAFDSSGNLWVADAGSYAASFGPDQVLEFSASSLAAGGSLDVAPTDTISGSNTKLNGPEGIAIGPSNEIVVTNDGTGAATSSITVYSSSATGNVKPIDVIAGSRTDLNEPEQVYFYQSSPTP